MIELKDICVSYGDNVIYDKLNCAFGNGINVVVGKSGSGKTTLLKVIANLVEYGGSCTCGKVAAVFQSPALAPISVLGNVRLVTDRPIDEVDEVLRLAKIDGKRNVNALRLSGGEQQRVSLARAFCAQRPVLLLDEPFQSLDFGLKQQLYATFCALFERYGETAVLVTHDIDEALTLADSLWLLDGDAHTVSLIARQSGAKPRDPDSAECAQLRKRLKSLLM